MIRATPLLDVRWFDGNTLLAEGDTLNYTGTMVSNGNAFQKTLGVETTALGFLDSAGIAVAPALTGRITSNVNGIVDFDVNSSIYLNSFDVYAVLPGLINFEINKIGGQNILNRNYLLQNGRNLIPIVRLLDTGRYEIRVNAVTIDVSDLYFQSSPRSSYYSSDSSLQIFNRRGTSSTYGYYYNFKFRSTCTSQLQPVYLYADCAVGLEDQSALNEVKIFPNPTNGLLNIQFNGQALEQIEVSNQLGQILLIENVDGLNETQLNLNVESGLYFIKLIEGESSYIQKIVVH